MTNSKVQILVFDNETESSVNQLVDLLRDSKALKLLGDFFRRCTTALRKEISTLNNVEQNQFPKFYTINELIDGCHLLGSYSHVINTVVVCLNQLGCFIRHMETTSDAYPGPDTIYTGLDIGLLSAAAIASSKSLTQLLPIAVDIVCVCFQVVLAARRIALQLEPESCLKDTWSMLVTNISYCEAQSFIDTFQKTYNLMPNKQAYISAESVSSITISGPPSTLKLLFSSSTSLASFAHNPSTITGVYHAGHLRFANIKSITDTQSYLNVHLVYGKVHSTRNGEPYNASNLQHLLVQIIEDILIEPLRWNHVIKKVNEQITLMQSNAIDIIPLTPSKAYQELTESLRQTGISINIKKIDEAKPAISQSHRSSDIAIVGMSCRFPGGDNLDEFWKTLVDGLDLCKPIPNDRFDLETHFDPTGVVKNSTLTQYGSFIDRPGLFDAFLFNMSPREAAQTDPQQRLALVTTYEALEMAGYVPNRTSSTDTRRISTFFGQIGDDWREVNASQNIDIYFITGGSRAFGPGRLNYYFKWEGPSYSIDTACSSSASAVQLASYALANYECDTAVAGGTNMLTAPDPFAGLSRGNFLSTTGSCKTFDDDADGYCRSDGVGCVVMKRLEDAIADNDNILCVLKGIVTNHSAQAVSITHPHTETQKRLYRTLLNNVGIHPTDVDYIEMHGTGTQAGDTSEIQSVVDIFSKGRDPKTPLFIGSVKANVGHSEAAAGITSIIKATLMLQKNAIPPHVGIKKRINSKFPPLDALHIHIPQRPMDFKCRTDKSKRIIMINNFNATGGNTTMLIEDAPPRVKQGVDPRITYVITVSAKTPFSFKENAKRLLTYITKYPESSIGDVSYTTTARRMHHMFRAAYAVTSTAELKSSLEELISSTDNLIRSSSVNVAFIFTGQGSHYFMMGKELYDNCSSFRRDILEYDNICQSLNLPSFRALIDGSVENPHMMSVIQTQLALIGLELALANLWISLGIKPAVVVGHSLGEYAALCVANVLSVNDTFFLVGRRASLMTSMCTQGTHAMLAVMLNAEIVEKDLSESNTSCQITCFNSPQSTIIGGYASEIAILQTFYASKGVKTRKLETPFAFHSSQLEPILKDFQLVAQNVSFGKPSIPIGSTFRGNIVQQEGIFTAEYLCRHARSPVQFFNAIRACKTMGIADDRTLWLEIGPKGDCLSMVKTILNVLESRAVQTMRKGESSLVGLAKGIAKAYQAGIDINWMAYHKESESSHQLLMLPTYAFDMENYWIQYEGDWSLRKNMMPSSSLVDKSTVVQFGTPSLQRIQEEKFSATGVSVVFVSDITNSKLRNVIQGHLVNKMAVCPACIYSDMALTAALYIHRRCTRSTSTVAMDIMDMKIFQPLIPKDDVEKQLVYIYATRKADSNVVELKFSSEEGSIKKDHASCAIRYGDSLVWMAELNRQAHTIRNRMADLVKAAEYDKSHRLRRGIIYKLFSSLVQYSERYRGMTEVWMDSDALEATANIKLQTGDDDSSFEYNPYWIDNIFHVSGFVLHGAETLNDDFVYISHGWRSMRIIGQLSAHKSYKSYVRMQPIDDDHKMIGDIYVFEEDQVIAACVDVEFQKIRRTVLERILLLNSGKIMVETLQSMSDDRKSFQSSANLPSTVDSKVFIFDDILEMISSETGMAKTKLHDDMNLADLGIDSLLTISILTRLRQLTNIDVSSLLFHTHSTIGDLRKFMATDRSNEIEISDSRDKPPDSDNILPSVAPRNTLGSYNYSSIDEMACIIRSIIASEIGCSENKIQPSTVLADLSMNNAIILSIISIVRSKTGINISETFFQGRLTFLEIINQLGLIAEEATSERTRNLNVKIMTQPEQSISVLLQGTSSNLTPLFLFADGSGSASSYLSLPLFHNGMFVYGLNSPFLTCPSKFTCTMKEVVEMYLAEVRRRQPLGPYIFGGWSYGGILAYEAATQLIASGDRVLGLILIDSPCPLTLPPLSVESIDVFESMNVFASVNKRYSGLPDTVRQHFIGTINALRQHVPKPMNMSNAPKACVLWAKAGVLESASHEHIKRYRDESENKATAWILESKQNYGPGGWEKLMPDVKCRVVPGNHFTIIKPPQVELLANEIEEAVAEFLKNN